MKQAVIRKTLTGVWTEFAFNMKSSSFFVKNFSDSDIYVSFENNEPEASAFKIKSNIGEEVAIAYNGINDKSFAVDKIYVKGTGEVEVQALEAYHYQASADIDSQTIILAENDDIQNNEIVLNSATINDNEINL